MGDVHGSAGVDASADGCAPDPGQSCLPLRVVGREERVAGSIREGVGHDPRGGRDLVRAYRGYQGFSHEEFYMVHPRKRCKRAKVRRLRWLWWAHYGTSTISSSMRTVRQFRMVLAVCN